MNEKKKPIRALLFDYGGVIADEGFRDGLAVIARRNGMAPEELLRQAVDAVYDSGYVVGRGTEETFWKLLKERTGISGENAELDREILQRFRLRPWMLKWVDRLREEEYRVGILSDQTDWLEKLDARDHFFRHFDRIFNSYHLVAGQAQPPPVPHGGLQDGCKTRAGSLHRRFTRQRGTCPLGGHAGTGVREPGTVRKGADAQAQRFSAFLSAVSPRVLSTSPFSSQPRRAWPTP